MAEDDLKNSFFLTRWRKKTDFPFYFFLWVRVSLILTVFAEIEFGVKSKGSFQSRAISFYICFMGSAIRPAIQFSKHLLSAYCVLGIILQLKGTHRWRWWEVVGHPPPLPHAIPPTPAQSTLNAWFVLLNNSSRTSLVSQWWRIRLPMQGTWVQSPVQEDCICQGAPKSMHHSAWASTPERMPLDKGSHCRAALEHCSWWAAPAPCNQRPGTAKRFL